VVRPIDSPERRRRLLELEPADKELEARAGRDNARACVRTFDVVRSGVHCVELKVISSHSGTKIGFLAPGWKLLRSGQYVSTMTPTSALQWRRLVDDHQIENRELHFVRDLDLTMFPRLWERQRVLVQVPPPAELVKFLVTRVDDIVLSNEQLRFDEPSLSRVEEYLHQRALKMEKQRERRENREE